MQHFPACKEFKQEGSQALGRSLEKDEKHNLNKLNRGSLDDARSSGSKKEDFLCFP